MVLKHWNRKLSLPKIRPKFKLFKQKQKKFVKGSGCGSVGRAVSSNTRGLQFVSSHRAKFILNIVYCQLYWKDENKEKEARNGPFLNKVWKWSGRFFDENNKNESKMFSFLCFCKTEMFSNTFCLLLLQVTTNKTLRGRRGGGEKAVSRSKLFAIIFSQISCQWCTANQAWAVFRLRTDLFA